MLVSAGTGLLALGLTLALWVQRAQDGRAEQTDPPTAERPSEAELSSPLERIPPTRPSAGSDVSDGQRAHRSAAAAIARAGIAHERRCLLEDPDITELGAVSEFLPALPTAEDEILVLRRYLGGHLVLPTDDGPIELSWSEHDCRIERARSGIVRGEVVDIDGHPVADAEVRVCASRTTTDASGRFELEATVDGSAPLAAETADCPIRAYHPNLGASITISVDVQGESEPSLRLESRRAEAQDIQAQQDVIDGQIRAIEQGELDPAFEANAEDADRLAELLDQPDLDPQARGVLVDAIRDLVEGASNEALLEALAEEPGR